MKIVPYAESAFSEVVALWDACGLSVPYNDPAQDIALVQASANASLFLGYRGDRLIGTIMTDMLDLKPEDTVLEVGTGLGYQSAVLAELAKTVCTVEIIEELAAEARKRLTRLGYKNIEYKVGDGSVGWMQRAPFDKIIVTAAPDLIPASLLTQLKPNGRMIIPAGIEDAQQLLLVEKDPAGRTRTKELIPVRFSTLVTSN